MTNNKVMIAKYERLSKEDGDDKESESIENQDSAIDSYIERIANPNWEVYDVYVDDGYTGLNFNRPDFQRLKQDIINKKIDLIVCTKQSRISRDSSGVDDFLFGFLMESQVRCIGILDGLDNFNRSNKKSAQITGLTNEWYSEEISYSVQSAFDEKRKKGEFIGSHAPYGYKKHPDNKNQLIIDKEVEPIIKDIFKLYLEGYGYVKIAQILNERKIPTPSEYKQVFNFNKNRIKTISWSYHTIRNILMNEAFNGNLVQKKTKTVNFKTGKRVKTHKSEIIRIENTHEPIIDRATFELVQKMMKERTKSRQYVGKKHIFSGLVVCGDCGRKLGYRHDNQTFTCFSYRSYGVKICTRHYFKLSDLEEIVLDDIKKMIARFNDKKSLKEIYNNQSKNKNNVNYLNAEINKIEKRLDKINNFKKGLYEDYKSEMISKEEYLKFKNEYSNEEKTLNSGLIEKRKVKLEIQNNQNINDDFEKILDKFINCDQLNYEMVNTFIDYINVYENNDQIKFRIEYKNMSPII